MLGWPEPYIYTVHDRIFGDFPAKNTLYTLYVYGSGQPYKCVMQKEAWICVCSYLVIHAIVAHRQPCSVQ